MNVWGKRSSSMNSGPTTIPDPLIVNELDTKRLKVGTDPTSYLFPLADGVNGSVLKTDGSGGVTWAPNPGQDPLTVNEATVLSSLTSSGTALLNGATFTSAILGCFRPR